MKQPSQIPRRKIFRLEQDIKNSKQHYHRMQKDLDGENIK